MTSDHPPLLTREAFVAALRAGALLVERYREAINALNVFPVPDGDTGTNMSLTLRSLIAALDETRQATMAETVAAATRAGLLGARGNSGVILSQWFTGFARRLALHPDACGPADMAEALAEARRMAYQAVSNPVEGTMLTVARGAAEAVEGGRHASFQAVLGKAVAGARRALAETPTMLRVLRDAGVVDAGGQGLVVFLEGMHRSARGEDIRAVELEGLATGGAGEAAFGRVDAGFLADTEHEIYGYCTQFILQGDRVDPIAVREAVCGMGRSAVVVGERGLVRVHVHVEDPGPVLSYAVSQGVVSETRMDHMDTQHREFMARHTKTESPAGTAVVAVAWGDGFARVFRGLRCAVVSAGRTMNSSARDLLDAARATGAAQVVLLPNNPNVIPAARQAADLAASGGTSNDRPLTLHVVPTRTLPQGVAAALAFNPETPCDPTLAAMRRAISDVRTLEVTVAVRDSVVDGRQVKAGQAMAILDGRLVALAASPVAALVDGVREADPETVSLVTVYVGADVPTAQSDAPAGLLRGKYPNLEVETVVGGQPLYPYIASLE